jgi:hypothetical protein
LLLSFNPFLIEVAVARFAEPKAVTIQIVAVTMETRFEEGF